VQHLVNDSYLQAKSSLFNRKCRKEKRAFGLKKRERIDRKILTVDNIIKYKRAKKYPYIAQQIRKRKWEFLSREGWTENTPPLQDYVC
jgi:hypothetical protein